MQVKWINCQLSLIMYVFVIISGTYGNFAHGVLWSSSECVGEEPLDIAKKFAQEIEGLGHNGSMTSKTTVNSRALNFLIKNDFVVISSGLVDKSIIFFHLLEYISFLPSSLEIWMCSHTHKNYLNVLTLYEMERGWSFVCYYFILWFKFHLPILRLEPIFHINLRMASISTLTHHMNCRILSWLC